RWTAEDGSLAIRTRYPGPVSRTRRLRTEGPRPRCDNERSEEHTSELQSRFDLVCRLLLEKKNDLVNDYSVAAKLVQTLDITSKLAISAAYEALHDAGIQMVREQIFATKGKILPGHLVLRP